MQVIPFKKALLQRAWERFDNQVEQRYAAWESKDGRSSTFRFEVVENGNIAKSYHGDIQFKEDGTGVATMCFAVN